MKKVDKWEERVCPKCRRLVFDITCPDCKVKTREYGWSGYLGIVDAKISSIAKFLDIEKNEEYALRVK